MADSFLRKSYFLLHTEPVNVKRLTYEMYNYLFLRGFMKACALFPVLEAFCLKKVIKLCKECVRQVICCNSAHSYKYKKTKVQEQYSKINYISRLIKLGKTCETLDEGKQVKETALKEQDRGPRSMSCFTDREDITMVFSCKANMICIIFIMRDQS